VSGPLLEAANLTLRFGSVIAFEEVTLRVDEGELLAVIGPNGAGKSSLFNVLSRIYRPATGTVTFAGQDLLGLRSWQLARLGIARSFQNLALYPHLTAVENVLIGRHHLMRSGALRGGVYLGFARAEESVHRRAAAELLDYLGIARYSRTPVNVLPYGIQKRVEFARCLAMEPRLLLLDEPVAGMSSEERQEVTALVRRLHGERGLTIILVEHDVGMVMSVAQRVMVLDFGRVICVGPPEQVQRDETVIRAYLGAAGAAGDGAVA
jgi:branched-chain amino acid transport system ATP-binding protein